MSLSYVDSNGNERAISGLNGLSGEMVMGASTIRTGTFTTDNGTTSGSVTFASPFTDTPEIVLIYGGDYRLDIAVTTRNKNSFGYVQRNINEGSDISGSYSYIAIKLYTVEGLEDIETNVASLNTYGKKLLWSGSATKGDTISIDSTGYDLLFAKVGGIIIPQANHIKGNKIGYKFTGMWTGRDTVDGGCYEQYYVLDIQQTTGKIMTCAWFDIASMNIQNARLAGQKALSCIANNDAWADPSWKGLQNVENSITVTEIWGYKFKTL
jgi:hypothetical protein